ncbi:hypothetical protein CTI12_AA298840 [Artemisia annua]|uniref:Shugoshin C-terminal domain-containing protein n=1 Tax=Artemisia annua TaxID=35608 RepID=A0A2U1N774_ARTAN|nr:hypothetical protein CTI12_AA298840 [Artemisia annua]
MDNSSSVHHPQLNVYADKPKVAGVIKGKTRILGRKTLGDISNISQRSTASSQVNKSQPSLDATREVNDQLQKENAALIKLLADKNTVIEISGAEVQKLRLTLQMVRQQNLQLAQSNTQLQMELNSVKESQKALKHELGCKNGLLLTKQMELEGLVKATMCQAKNNDVTEPKETEVCTVAESGDDKHLNTNSSQISESLVPFDKKIDDNDTGKARRLQTRRRQSARFMLDDQKIDIVDDLLPSLQTSRTKKEDKEVDYLQDFKPQERKTSLSRPVREAAKKVQSYKEINLNVKMRRE